MASSYTCINKYLRFSSYIRKPFLIYDFATAPIWISLYMRKIFFSFLSVRICPTYGRFLPTPIVFPSTGHQLRSLFLWGESSSFFPGLRVPVKLRSCCSYKDSGIGFHLSLDSPFGKWVIICQEWSGQFSTKPAFVNLLRAQESILSLAGRYYASICCTGGNIG